MAANDLPPLHFLPAFEAAGRLGSFKAAAELLHLTPSAISQQIKALEAALGVALFERHGRAVLLTAEGRAYLQDVQHMLSDLASASRRVRRRAHGESLQLSTVDFFAFEFLLPRLSAFRVRFPGVELRLTTSMDLIDFDTSDIDAAIRVGGGPWPGLVSEPIGSTDVAVVGSAALVRKIRVEQDFLAHTLIELRGQEHRGWHAITAGLGIARSKVHILTFDSYFETMLAAEQGLGLAFGLFPMTSAWVAAGRLSVPLATRMPLPGHVSLVHRPTDHEQSFFSEFAGWLREQYAALAPLPAGRIVAPKTPKTPKKK